MSDLIPDILRKHGLVQSAPTNFNDALYGLAKYAGSSSDITPVYRDLISAQRDIRLAEECGETQRALIRSDTELGLGRITRDRELRLAEINERRETRLADIARDRDVRLANIARERDVTIAKFNTVGNVFGTALQMGCIGQNFSRMTFTHKKSWFGSKEVWDLRFR